MKPINNLKQDTYSVDRHLSALQGRLEKINCSRINKHSSKEIKSFIFTQELVFYK